MKLLLREYDSFDGRSPSGASTASNTLECSLGSIGYVPQDHFLFSMTIRDNIRFAQPRASQAEVEAAAGLAVIHEDISRFLKGTKRWWGTWCFSFWRTKTAVIHCPCFDH